MRFEGAIFDVDGVLVDSPHERAWREALERLMAGPWRDIAPRTSYAPERFTTEFYQAYLAGKPREAGARAALDYFGVPDPDGQRLREYCEVKQADMIALIARGAFVAFDDALRFLVAVKAAGVKVAAASSSKNANLFLSKVSMERFVGSLPQPAARLRPGSGQASPATAEGEQARGGEAGLPRSQDLSASSVQGPEGEGPTLLDLFDANVCGRDFAHGKPAPDIFLAAGAELGLPPEHCFVVEDATSGVQAAKAAGMASVGIARLGDAALLRAAGADWVVTSLDELPVSTLLDSK
jgi:beta-phosphoglucomutase